MTPAFPVTTSAPHDEHSQKPKKWLSIPTPNHFPRSQSTPPPAENSPVPSFGLKPGAKNAYP
jgi:hypothetical protein